MRFITAFLSAALLAGGANAQPAAPVPVPDKCKLVQVTQASIMSIHNEIDVTLRSVAITLDEVKRCNPDGLVKSGQVSLVNADPSPSRGVRVRLRMNKDGVGIVSLPLAAEDGDAHNLYCHVNSDGEVAVALYWAKWQMALQNSIPLTDESVRIAADKAKYLDTCRSTMPDAAKASLKK